MSHTTSPEGPGIVLKLGGSLLDWPGLPEALQHLITALRPKWGNPVVLVGGGRIVDELRRLDAIHRVPSSPMHQLAIRAMDLTAHLLTALVPAVPWCIVGSEPALRTALAAGHVPIVAPWGWLERDGPGNPLPHGWDTTSDSIAVHLAWRIGAPAAVLLKSASAPAPVGGLRAAVSTGLIDPVVPSQCLGLHALGLCNLRHEPIEITWLPLADSEPRPTVSPASTPAQADRPG